MAADMKKRKKRLPRKLKKAVSRLQIYEDTGKVEYRWLYRLRHYPRTKWVVKGESLMRRMVHECKRKDTEIHRIENDLRILHEAMNYLEKNAARIKKEMNSIKREEA